MGLFDALFGKKKHDTKRVVMVESVDCHGNRDVREVGDYDGESFLHQGMTHREAMAMYEARNADFDARIADIHEAQRRLDEGDDTERSLDAMWRILVDEYDLSPGWSYAWYDRFAKHLVNYGQNDRAWRMLDLIAEKRQERNDLWHIRDIQCWVSKKEGRYVEAMRFLMCKFFLRATSCTDYEGDRFVKEAKPIANKLKLDAKHVEYLSYLIETALKRGAKDECFVIDAYDRAIAEFGL